MVWEVPEPVLSYIADVKSFEIADLHSFLVVEMDAVISTRDQVDGSAVIEDFGSHFEVLACYCFNKSFTWYVRLVDNL